MPQSPKERPAARRRVVRRESRRLFLESLEDRRLLAAGDPDATFGLDGKSALDFYGTSSVNSSFSAVAVQADGKVIAAGSANPARNSRFDPDLALARYNTDGSLDASFGTSGHVTTNLNRAGRSREEITDVAVLADGKILAAGFGDLSSSISTPEFDFVLVRYNADGEVDTSFGSNGLARTDFGTDSDQGLAMAVQPDGRIVMAGISDGSLALARYEPDGGLDPSFGDEGTLTHDIGGHFPSGVDIQGDGRIVVSASGGGDFRVIRLQANGQFDNSFDGDGVAVVDFGGNDIVHDVLVDASGRILLAGGTDVGSDNDFAVARLTASGSLDSTFSGDGRATANILQTGDGRDEARAIVLQSDGKIVVAGESDGFGAARFNEEGTLDSTFSNDGTLRVDGADAFSAALGPNEEVVLAGTVNGDGSVLKITSTGEVDTTFHSGAPVVDVFQSTVDSHVTDAVVQADGKVIVVGAESVSFGSGATDFTISRLLPDGSLDQSFGTRGHVARFAGIASSVALQSDGKILIGGTNLFSDFKVARLNPDGTTDNSFGVSGSTEFNVLGVDSVRDLVVQPDGKILVAGRARSGSQDNRPDVGLARLLADGTLDPDFGVDGVVADELPLLGTGDVIELLADGKIVVGNTTSTSVPMFQVVRYNSDGTRDTTFGSDGTSTQRFGQDKGELKGLAVQADGSIVAVGTVTSLLLPTELGVARFGADGSVDGSFGDNGSLRMSFDGPARATGVVVDSSGRILIGGDISGDFAALRLLGDGTADIRFGDGGTSLIDFAGRDDATRAIALSPSGEVVVAGKVDANSLHRAIGVARLLTEPEACPAAGCLQFAQYEFPITEADGVATVEVVRSQGSAGAVSVRLVTSDITAIAGDDYVASSIELDFPSGVVSRTAQISIVADGISEGAERIGLSLVEVTGGAALENPRNAVVEILTEGGNAGKLDAGFGAGGVVQVDFGRDEEAITDLALQEDGKVIAVGYSSRSSSGDFLVARFQPDGSLDPSFGDGGLVQTDFSLSHEEALAVAVQPDGKIVVVGEGDTVTSPTSVGGEGVIFHLPIARYLPDGRLDRTFGDAGRLLITNKMDEALLGGISLRSLDVQLLDNGQMLILLIDGRVIRLEADGEIDKTFGAGGVATAPGISRHFNRDVYRFGLQSDGKIVIGGVSELDDNDDAVTLARLLPDGQVDGSFGTNGLVQTDAVPGEDDGVVGLEIQSDDKIIVAGGTGPFLNDDFLLLRYNADGSLDTSYDEDGIVVTDFTPDGNVFSVRDTGYDVALQPDGKAVVFGTADFNEHDFAVARYRTDGSLDTSFGVNGKAVLPVGSNFKDGGALLIQDDNAIVVGSTGHFGDLENEFTLARFLGDPQPGVIQFNAAEFAVDENDPLARVVLRRNGGANGEVTVDVATTNGGTATAGEDFTPTSAEITFAPGETLKVLVVPIADNDPEEGVETVNLVLSNPGGDAVLGSQTTAVLEIFDGPGEFQFLSPLFNINENGGLAEVVVERIHGSDGAVTVDFQTTPGSALEGLDYQDATQSVSFEDGQRTAVVTVPVFDDLAREAIETVQLSLVNPGGGASLGTRPDSVLNIFDLEVGTGTTAGSIDLDFGEAGTASLAIPDASLAVADALQLPDGKLLVAGEIIDFSGDDPHADFFVARFFADGSVDSSFGSGGTARVDFDSGEDSAQSIAVTDDGKIVVAGYSESGLSSDTAVARLDADGQLDSTFGTGGKVVTDFGGRHDSAYGVAVQADGKIVSVGASGDVFQRDFAVIRYNADGSLDNGFSGDGKAAVDFDSYFDVAREVVIDRQNRILVGGTAENSALRRTTAVRSGDVALVRFNSNGSLDTSFAGDGILRQDFLLTGNTFAARTDDDELTRLLIQPDDKILVGGGSDGNFLVARFHPDGSLDTGFGRGGAANLGFIRGSDTTAGDEIASGLAFQPDGKIVVAGTSGFAFAASRLDVHGLPDVGFGATGGVTNSQLAVPDDVVVQVDGSTLAVSVGFDQDFNSTIDLTRFFAESNCPSEGCFQFRVTGFDVNETAGEALVTVTRPFAASDGDVSVSYLTFDGTATAGEDYTAVVGTLQFGDTQSTASFTIPIQDDPDDEGDEQILLALTAPTGGAVLGAQSVSVLTIVDDDREDTEAGRVSGFQRTVRETAGALSVSVFRSGGAKGRVTVDYSTRDGSALAGEDYVPVFGTIVLEDGETFSSFSIPIINDSNVEGNEQFSFFLTNPTGNATLGASTEGLVTILDADPLQCSNAGDLHTAFGDDGVMTVDLGQDEVERANAIIPMDDGRFLAAGRSGRTDAVGLTRHLADGSLDPTFGSGGIVTTNIGPGTDDAFGAHIQDDGRILVLARAFTLAVDRTALLRYNADGTLDSTFGDGGIVLHELAIFRNDLSEMVVQSDGKIVVAGESLHERGSESVLVRFNADGSLDSTFGVDGQTLFGLTFDGAVSDLALQGDGKILASFDFDDRVARFNSDGTFDASFGDGGIVSTDSLLESDDQFVSVRIDELLLLPDGRILGAGSGFVSDNATGAFTGGPSAIRLFADGTLDASYGDAGVAIIDDDDNFVSVRAAALQPNGRVIVAGATFSDFVLTRFLADGTIDTGFGDQGLVITDLGGADAQLNDVVVTSVGRVLAAGYRSLQGEDFAFTQYVGGTSGGQFRLHGDRFRIAEDGGSLDIVVERVCGRDGEGSVQLATTDISAFAGIDYVGQTEILNFPDQGETLRTVTISIIDDFQPLGDVEFNVSLSNPQGATLQTVNSADITIVDDEQPGEFRFRSIVYSAGEEEGTASITIDRINGDGGLVTVNLATSDDTATAGQDYTSINEVVTFDDGQSSRTVNIPIGDDDQLEDDEHVRLELTDPSGGASLGFLTTARLTIVDDEIPPPIRHGSFEFSEAEYEADEDVGTVAITVQRVDGSDGRTTVDFDIENATAVTPLDYLAYRGTLQFLPGETSKTLRVLIRDDDLDEADELIALTLSQPTGAATLGDTSTATLRILDNDVDQADLSLVVSDDPDPVGPGAELTYRIQVTNQGPGTAAAAAVTADLPSGFQLVESSGADCADDNGQVSCSIGDIPNGVRADVDLRVLVPTQASGTVTASIGVDAATSDPDLSQNNVDVETTIRSVGIWKNPLNALDVIPDGTVAPNDVLVVINYINDNPGSSALPEAPATGPPYYDVNCDGFVSPVDVLLVINFLNRGPGGEGETSFHDSSGAPFHAWGTANDTLTPFRFEAEKSFGSGRAKRLQTVVDQSVAEQAVVTEQAIAERLVASGRKPQVASSASVDQLPSDEELDQWRLAGLEEVLDSLTD